MKCITLYVVGAFDKNVWCSESKELHCETQPRFGTKIDVNWKALWVQLFIFFVVLILESKSKSYMFCLSKFEWNLSIFTISLFGERTWEILNDFWKADGLRAALWHCNRNQIHDAKPFAELFQETSIAFSTNLLVPTPRSEIKEKIQKFKMQIENSKLPVFKSYCKTEFF